ncbi:hypothetical protein [Actinoplanes sp. NPDC051851]|uniref:hypothetical protein n=1 Tax=Actinoplanes sp. NPDC051851 TaxID=3154753 RepID=UPI00342250A4
MRAIVAGLLLALAVSGCRAREEPAAPASSWDITAMPDPCRLLTRAEVSRVVGRDAEAGVRLASWPPLCEFVLRPDSTLLYVGDDAGATGRQEFDQMRNSGSEAEAVYGVGDEAYWLPELTSLHVMNGATHLKVVFAGPGVPAAARAREAATALAGLAILDGPRTPIR